MESGWGSVVEGDFDAFAGFALKTVPLPLQAPSTGSAETASISSSSHSQQQQQQAGSGGGGGAGIGSANSANNPDSAYAVRSVPVKIYLPQDAPVLQEAVAPLDADGMSGPLPKSRNASRSSALQVAPV